MSSSAELRLSKLRKNVAEAAQAAGRNPDEVRIVGVSKFHSAESVAEMIRAGLRDLGENRVQEAAAKRPEVERLLAEAGLPSKDVRWHFIGHLQANKAAKAAALFEVVQSVDSIDLARRLGQAAADLGRVTECLVQVNTSGEATKSGASASGALEIAEAIAAEPVLKFTGLMTIGPLTEEEARIRRAFDELRGLAGELEEAHPEWRKLQLSMGMSGDYLLAIAAGATIIRVGTALFGPRPTVSERVK